MANLTDKIARGSKSLALAGVLGLSGCASEMMYYVDGVNPHTNTRVGTSPYTPATQNQVNWRVFVAKEMKLDEYGLPQQAVDPRTTFSKNEPFVVGIANDAGKTQGFGVYFSQDGLTWEKKGSSGRPVESFSLHIKPGQLEQGTYFLEFRDGINRVCGFRRTIQITD